MKNFFILIVALATFNAISAQETLAVDSAMVDQPTPKKVRKSNGNSSNNVPEKAEKHSADHILVQFGSDTWMNKPSSINTSGGKHFNFYLMTDKPFKTNPKFSVAYGLGIGSSNIYFNNTSIKIQSDSSKLTFTDLTGQDHFKKYKLTELFLELPVELRYNFDNLNPSKSWKIAIGAKVGTLIKAYTKGKDYQTAAGVSKYGATYIEKEYSKKFFNSTRLTFTGRVGYGNFSLHAAYTLTPVIKSGFGPDMNTLSVGLCISGL